MDTARLATARLVRLQEILAHPIRRPANGSESTAADVHLNSVPVDRIRELTAELRRGLESPLDIVEAVNMRLLLNEYSAAVAHLRAVARLAAGRVDAAPAPIKAARKALHRSMKVRGALTQDLQTILDSEPEAAGDNATGMAASDD